MKPTFKNKGNEEVELPDGRKVWLSRANAVVAVVLGIHMDNIFVLAEKRSSTMMDAPGLWAVPSGYLDWDESGWEAVVRELYEETSFYVPKYENNLITDNDQQPFFVRSDPGENRQNIAMSYCLIYDFSKKLPKEVESYKDSEVDEIKWIPIEQIFGSKRKWAFNHDERIAMAVEKFEKYLI